MAKEQYGSLLPSITIKSLFKGSFVVLLIGLNIWFLYSGVIAAFIPSTYLCQSRHDITNPHEIDRVIELCSQRGKILDYSIVVIAISIFVLLKKFSGKFFNLWIITICVVLPSWFTFNFFYTFKMMSQICTADLIGSTKGYPTSAHVECSQTSSFVDFIFFIICFSVVFCLLWYFLDTKKQSGKYLP